MLLAVNEAVHLITADATEADCPPLQTTENVGSGRRQNARNTNGSKDESRRRKNVFVFFWGSSWYLGPKGRRTVASSDAPLTISQNKRL